MVLEGPIEVLVFRRQRVVRGLAFVTLILYQLQINILLFHFVIEFGDFRSVSK